MSLTLRESRAVSDRVREHAVELGASVTIAIVDAGGHLQVPHPWTVRILCRRESPRLRQPALRCFTATART